VTSNIRDCVRDQDRIDQISDLIEEGREHYGSQTFDQHLMELVESDTVDFEVARRLRTTWPRPEDEYVRRQDRRAGGNAGLSRRND
jgi:Tfp pilus assembly pilus retraction ATPase PilT